MSVPAEATRRLASAEWLTRPDLQQVMSLLDGGRGRTRAVGGIVRDTLLGHPRPNTDVDLATELLPHEVTLRAERAGINVYPTGIDHGTVTLKLGALLAEVTTLREDVETDGRRAVVKFGTDWSRDAERRDFTMNALYASQDGTLFDPLNGLADCLSGTVRFIGDPAQRILEDRLRVYRFFRFSASHGGERFDADGFAACRAAATKLGTVSAERVGTEMKRMLALPKVARTLKAMTDAGVLHLSADLLTLLMTYERRGRRPDVVPRLALVMSELGADELKSLWRLSNDDVVQAESVLAVAQLLRDYRLNEAAYRHPAALADGLEVAAVQAGWTGAGKAAIMDQLQQLEIPRFPLGGGDLIQLGMRPGRALGAELDRLEQLWIASSFSLDRTALLELVQPT